MHGACTKARKDKSFERNPRIEAVGGDHDLGMQKRFWEMNWLAV